MDWNDVGERGCGDKLKSLAHESYPLSAFRCAALSRPPSCDADAKQYRQPAIFYGQFQPATAGQSDSSNRSQCSISADGVCGVCGFPTSSIPNVRRQVVNPQRNG